MEGNNRMKGEVTSGAAGYIVSWEAIYLGAYRDVIGVVTIGGGHTAAAGGMKPKMGDIITMPQALQMLRDDLSRVFATVDKAIRTDLGDVRRGMVGSLEFNTGSLVKGTVDDKLNAGQTEAALSTWLQYNKAGGRVVQGLVNRRRDEVATFRANKYPARTVLVYDRPGAKGRVVPVSGLPWNNTPPSKIEYTIPPLPEKSPQGNFLLQLIQFIWSKL